MSKGIYKFVNDYLLTASPKLSNKEKAYFILLSSTYTYLFLVFFQPFGINNYDPQERITFLFLLLVLSMVVFGLLLMSIIEFLVWPRLPKIIDNVLLWICIHLIWLSSGIFIYYNFLGGWHDFTWSSYFEFGRTVSVLWIVPFILLLIYKQYTSLQETLESVHNFKNNLKEDNELITIKADNEKYQVTISLKHLLYIENEDNYVAIYYLSNNIVSKTLLRKTLKNIQKEINHPALVRCHRSLIINQFHLQTAHGNRNKLTLQLNHVQRQLPVSRQYINDIYSLLNI